MSDVSGDVWVEVEFTIGVRQTKRGDGSHTYKLDGAWQDKPNYLDKEIRLVRVKLDVPESLWGMPQVKGRLESRLHEEWEALLEEMQ